MGLVIVMLLVFWPIGLILLIAKLTNDKRTVLNVNCHKPISRFSIFVLIVIIGLIVVQLSGVIGNSINMWNDFAINELRATEFMITANITVYPLVTGLVVLFVILRVIVVKMKRDAERLKRYIPLIANQNMRKVDEIARALGLPRGTVTKDLRKLCAMGVFPNLLFNPTIGLLHERFAQQPARPPVPPPMQQHRPMQPQLPPVPPICPNCGATTRADMRDCEYCGSRY